MWKKGVSHIEAIISFLLFIGFVFTALYFFAPTGNTNLIDSTLLYTLNAVSANTSVTLQTYSVKIENSNVPPPNNGVVAIDFPVEIITIPTNYKVRAEKYDGTPLPATKVGNTIYVKPLGESFVMLKFSEDLTDGTQVNERPAVQSDQYQISSSSTRKILSEKRALEFNRSYNAEYESLKNSLGIPSQASFGFSIQLPTYVISVPTEIPEGIEVFSTITRREILTNAGTTSYGEVNVKVW
jgi:hypothetical protein